uniref:RIIa domain-containing protein n=1 Tax=Erpetoichthys calabaricus TaxID=27687 RepID=A0A8C4SHY4_ERPCA
MAVPLSNTNLRVPQGFGNVLEGLTREILREQPADIPTFAALYFKMLVKKRQGQRCHAMTFWVTRQCSLRPELPKKLNEQKCKKYETLHHSELKTNSHHPNQHIICHHGSHTLQLTSNRCTGSMCDICNSCLQNKRTICVCVKLAFTFVARVKCIELLCGRSQFKIYVL